MNWSKNNFAKVLLVLSGVIFVYYIAITVNFEAYMNGIDNSYLHNFFKKSNETDGNHKPSETSVNNVGASSSAVNSSAVVSTSVAVNDRVNQPKTNATTRKIAIIVPFRDREQHFLIFQDYIHQFLLQQSVEYHIFVIEQEKGDLFNRGSLMNVGFLEAFKAKNWSCYIFHDTDLLPKDQNTTYKCYDDPYHMASAIDKFNYKLPYADNTGGVLAFTETQFRKCNGYSNKYWGWGGEDDDMTYRIKNVGYSIFRLSNEISKYDALQHGHKTADEAKNRFQLLKTVNIRFKQDGLNDIKNFLKKSNKTDSNHKPSESSVNNVASSSAVNSSVVTASVVSTSVAVNDRVNQPKTNATTRKIAIIVPFRDREQHFLIFQDYMHQFLLHQSVEYHIFVIEQEKGDLFNRGSLMNVGFLEAIKAQNWSCYIFHDTDLLPKDQNITYKCYDDPYHMASAINKFNYQLPYADYTGGVLAFTETQFRKCNGYSNKYWGWGGEDDDMTYRIKNVGYSIFRLSNEISKYDSLQHGHKAADEAKNRFQLLKTVSIRFKQDGLNDIDYEIIKINKNLLYTRLLIKLFKK